MQCLVPCVVNGSKADVNYWLKGETAFGCANSHNVKEVSYGHMGSSTSSAKYPGLKTILLGIVPGKESTKSGPAV